MLYAVIPCSIQFLKDIGGQLINPYNIMYTDSGYKLLNRKPPFGDRLALFAFLARGECAGRSVISSQIVLLLHFINAHNPVFSGECLLCKPCTMMSGSDRK